MTYTRQFDFGDQKLTIDTPDNWIMEIDQSHVVDAIVFYTPKGEVIQCSAMPIVPGRLPNDHADIAHVAQEMATMAAAESGVDQLQATKCDLPCESDVYYVQSTDAKYGNKTPPPGEFKYSLKGVRQVGMMLIWITVLTNDKTSTVREDALKMLCSMSS